MLLTLITVLSVFFVGCTQPKTPPSSAPIEDTPTNKCPLSTEGYTLFIDGTTLEGITYTDASAAIHVIIPEGVTKITQDAMYRLLNAVAITLPSTLTELEYKHYYISHLSRTVEIYNNSPIKIKDTPYAPILNGSLKKVHQSPDEESVITVKDGFAYYLTSYNATILGYTEKKDTLTVPSKYEDKPCVLAVGAFAYADLDKLVLSEGITYISEYCFFYSRIKEELSLPSTLTTIKTVSFSYCSEIGSLTIPKSVTTVGEDAFLNAHFTRLELPEDLKRFKTDLWTRFTADTLFIPSTVSDTLFYKIQPYITVSVGYEVHPDNQYLCAVDGVLFDKKCEKLLDYPENRPGEEYTVPNGVKEIYQSALSSSTYLKKITVSDGVEKIGSYAFQSSAALETVILPKTVTEIGYEIFSLSSLMKEVSVHNDNPSYTAVDGVLFSKDMTTLIYYPSAKQGWNYTVPEGVTAIESRAFHGCYDLRKVTLPEGLLSIGSYAFSFSSMHGEQLTVNLPDSLEYIGRGAFKYRNLVLLSWNYTGDWLLDYVGSADVTLTEKDFENLLYLKNYYLVDEAIGSFTKIKP